MIEKRPYWHDPSISPQSSTDIEQAKIAKFSPLSELPIAFGSWCYDTPLEEAPVFCTYPLSNGTSEQFLLRHYSDSPDGQLMLKMTITDQDNQVDSYFTLRKVRPDCYVMTHHYSEPEFAPDFEIDVDWEDVASRAADESASYSWKRELISRQEEIDNSPFKDLYLDAVMARNKKVGELMFDRTFTEVFDHVTEKLPLYVKSTSSTPSYKTGKSFDRYFLLDNPTDREIKGGSLYFGPKYEIAKEDVVIFRAGLHNGKKISFRNQPVARIQPNGEIDWQSFEDKQIFSLEVRDFLQELMGDEGKVVNREFNEAAKMNGPLFTADVAKQLVEAHGSIIYDKNSDYGGDLLIIKAEPEVLATNLVAMLRSNFGLSSKGVRPIIESDNPDYYSNQDFIFELYADTERRFANSFYEALSD
jgi:hypothetical protein